MTKCQQLVAANDLPPVLCSGCMSGASEPSAFGNALMEQREPEGVRHTRPPADFPREGLEAPVEKRDNRLQEHRGCILSGGVLGPFFSPLSQKFAPLAL